MTGDVHNIDHLLWLLGPWDLAFTQMPHVTDHQSLLDHVQPLLAMAVSDGSVPPNRGHQGPGAPQKLLRNDLGAQQRAQGIGTWPPDSLPGTRGLPHRSYDHAMMGQSCFGCTILSGCFFNVVAEPYIS